MKADLRAAHVILEDLLDDVNILSKRLEARQRLVNISPRPFDDEGSESTQDMLKIIATPDVGLAHRLDKIGTGEESNPGLNFLFSVCGQDTAGDGSIDFGLEVVQDLGCGNKVGLWQGNDVRARLRELLGGTSMMNLRSKLHKGQPLSWESAQRPVGTSAPGGAQGQVRLSNFVISLGL